MCGIFSLVNLKRKNLDMVKLFEDFMNLKHRGPDNSYFETYNNVMIGFHRLAIIDDTFSANQPFILEDEHRTIIFICNGEIFNFKELIELYKLSSSIKNDCMLIPEVFMDMLKYNATNDFNKFIKEDIKGEFAFILYEFDRLKNLKKVIVGRDEIGVRPLYYTPDATDTLFFASEVKGGLSQPHQITEFPPGHIFTYTIDELDNISCDKYDFSTVYDVVAQKYPIIDDVTYCQSVQKAILNSVRRRLTADKPFAFLLSGGVDSSLVAAISAKILGRPIRTFCCGMNEGTDLQFARKVAKHIGSNHTEVFFTPEEGLAAIPDVIRTIESWDTTSVRASVGQYLVSKWISQNTDCKVVLCGEGPDEICSSYLFNWYCPNGDALDDCAKEYVKNIHYYDVKRADRCICRWGLEGRVPLLDPEFIKEYWKIPGEKRMPTYKNMEKWFLREAFRDTGILPDEVLWRKKEAFSDAVSSKEKSWYQIIQEYVEELISEEDFSTAKERYPYCTPQTKEAFYYRKVFCQIFGEDRQEIVPGYWQPKWNAEGQEVTEYIDPSARVLGIYNETS